jgi:hypothetical protein
VGLIEGLLVFVSLRRFFPAFGFALHCSLSDNVLRQSRSTNTVLSQ